MNKKELKQNYYKTVNKEWFETAEIPGDQPSISAFVELHLGIEKTLIDLTNEWNENPTVLNEILQNFIKFYRMTIDFETREKLGVKPIEILVEKINNLKSLKDLEENYVDLTYSSINLPFGFNVMQDFKNSNHQVLYFGASGLILPDTTYYQDEQTKQQLLGLYTMTTTQILTLFGYSAEEINQLLANTIAFDALLVPVTKSSVERADYVKMYNPLSKAEVLEKSKTLNLIPIAEQLVGMEVDQIIFTNLDFINKYEEIINEQHFEIIKSWMLVKTLLDFTSELTEDLRVAGGAFMRALSGTKEPRSQEKSAFYKAYNSFSQAVGLYYGENYFGPVAKKDVQVMVHEMIEVYKERIKDNVWLDKKTKEKAIKKVASLSVHVGYPDELPPYYQHLKIKDYSEGSNILLESIKINELIIKDNFKKYNQEPNRNLWSMPASMVNAYYSPFNNQIVFPAAILQRPYYSLDQTPSENYGGIGAVIAHEISHAFDNNGAKFDETGSLANWWTEKDFETFDNKAKDMIKLFDGVETGFGPCNGELTVSENIADSGGLRAALEASKKLESHCYEEFFMNWARVWRQKSSEQYAQLLLRVDVHGPAVLRANMQLSNLPEFQDFYKLTKDDEMYLDKDKMVSIW